MASHTRWRGIGKESELRNRTIPAAPPCGAARKLRELDMKTLFAAVLVAAVLHSPGGASAQAYPSRPITMIVPFAAGGPADRVGRIVAEGMRAALNQPIVIED
jgi:hypothetical protein